MVVDIPEARVRRMESGRLLLALPGFPDKFFDDEAALDEHLHDMGRYGPFQNGLCVDHEPAQRRAVARARIDLCGSPAGDVVTR